MEKGFSLPVAVAIVAVLALGGWWYLSQKEASVDTDSAAGIVEEGSGVNDGPAGGASADSVDGAIADVLVSGDAEASQAQAEDGTEGAAQVTGSLNSQTVYE